MTHQLSIGSKKKNEKPRSPEAVTETTAPEFGSFAPQDFLQLQHDLGNQAVLRMTENGTLPQPRTLSSLMIQRLPTSVAVQDAMDKDIKKQKKLEESKKSESKPEGEGTTLDGIWGALKSMGEQLLAAIDKASFDALLKSLDDFHTYDKAFKKLTPAYTDHIERLQKIKDVQNNADIFLSLHKKGDPGFSRVSALRDEVTETYIRASPNADRAIKTRSELKGKKASDKNSPTRITDELIEVMVMSVASPMSETSDKGSSGILGIQSAVDAADALMLMRKEDYEKIQTMLLTSGDEFGDTSKQATLLKAVAARKADLVAAGPQTEEALKQLEEFRAKIAGMDKAEMIEKTHVADRGSGVGLQQRYTMSCGPTSIQIVKGEFDPIYALKINEEGKKSLDYGGDIAAGQKAKLEGENGVDTAVPREVEDDWTKAVPLMNTYYGTLSGADKVNVKHFFQSVAGTAHNATKADAGLALIKTNVAGVDFDKRVPEWKKYYAFLGGAPGLGNQQFAKLAKAELESTTGRTFDETPISYKQKLIGGKTVLRGEIKKYFTPLDKALFRGKSVPLGVMWAGGGGHFMVFTDIMQKKEGNKLVKYYLISDPWEGHSGWMNRQDLIEGSFGKIGASQGAIDSIYL